MPNKRMERKSYPRLNPDPPTLPVHSIWHGVKKGDLVSTGTKWEQVVQYTKRREKFLEKNWGKFYPGRHNTISAITFRTALGWICTGCERANVKKSMKAGSRGKRSPIWKWTMGMGQITQPLSVWLYEIKFGILKALTIFLPTVLHLIFD